MPAADLSQSVARARTQAEAAAAAEENAEPEIIPAETAFLVYRNSETGQIVMTHDINAPLQCVRTPNHDDVYMMMNVILKDMAASQTAALTVQGLMQAQQQIAQQMMSPEEQKAMQAMMMKKGGIPVR
jgi:siroheme synthase